MAFMSMFGEQAATNPVNPGSGNRLDQSQIDKLKESGYQITPVASNPEMVSLGTPTAKQVLPGISVPGFQDPRGNFYVVQENGIVNQVTTKPPMITEDTPQKAPPLIYNPDTPVLPFNGQSDPYTESAPPPPPISNFGSGKIFTRFDVGDIVPNQQEIVTRAMWSGNVGNLLTFYTASYQTALQKRYNYDIFNSCSCDCGSELQFSIEYGHKAGSGSADAGGQINDTPTRAVYGRYRLLCLEGDTPRFTIGGSTTDQIYVINISRERMRDYVDEGNLEINIAELSGSRFLAGSGSQNAHTGSNVKLSGTGKVIRLIDNSRTTSATITSAGETYSIVSGSLEDGVYNSSAPHVYGTLYRRLGFVVLNADTLDLSASFLTVTGSEVAGDNAYKLFTAISGAAKYTDASGDYLGFQARSAERVKSTHYFCRIRNSEYNFSNNPTFVTGSEGDLAEPMMIGNPVTYITAIGLYNERKECVAVAKVSRPIKKMYTQESIIQVKLEFVLLFAIIGGTVASILQSVL